MTGQRLFSCLSKVLRRRGDYEQSIVQEFVDNRKLSNDMLGIFVTLSTRFNSLVEGHDFLPVLVHSPTKISLYGLAT